MSRELQIPLALWMCAAFVAHFAGGGGAVVATKAAEEVAAERAEILQAVHDLRREVRAGNGTLEVDMVEVAPPELEPPPADPTDESAASDEKADPDAEADPEAEAKKKEEEKPEPEKERPEVKPPTDPPIQVSLPQLAPPPPREEEAKPDEAKPVEPPKPLEPPKSDGRIAVVQHVPKDQEDNPEAQRIADDANNVLEETMARERSFDQDNPEPTPGTNMRGPTDQVGNDTTDKVAHAEEKPGDRTKAPGEAAPAAAAAPTHAAPPPPSPPNADRPSASGPSGAPGTQGKPDQPRGASQPDPGSSGGRGPASPEVVSSQADGYTIDPTNPGGDGRTLEPGRQRKPSPFSTRVDVRSLGLGGSGLPGGPTMNLTQDLVERAVGPERLAAERASAGAALRSRRTGRMDTNKFERWRPAIENYDPSVKLGNQTSLNAARKVYAGFLNHVHNRIHPVFAEEFLDSLDRVAKRDTLNDTHLIAHVEIVLRKEDGAITRMGITRNSGSTVFDAAALESIQRASPFGRAPDPIVSPDGMVYLHWEFHRDPHDACSSRNARPYLLASAPPSGPGAPRRPTPPPSPSEGSPPRRGPGDSPRPGAPRAPDGPRK
jgi:hypothetical protein